MYFRTQLPNLVKSINMLNFTSQSGWNVNFNSFGNAPPRYDFYNLVKTQTDTDTEQSFTYQKVNRTPYILEVDTKSLYVSPMDL